MALAEAIIVITLILTAGAVFIIRANARNNGRDEREANENARVVQRLDDMERRLENLETIVIQREKSKAYDSL